MLLAGHPYSEGEEGLYDYGGEERLEEVTSTRSATSSHTASHYPDTSLQTPKFVSQSMKVLVNEGDTIR